MHRLNTPEIVAAFWETRFPGKLPDKLMFPPEPLTSQTPWLRYQLDRSG